MSQIHNLEQFELQEIKEHGITAEQIDALYATTNSYEKMFSKRAKLYKERGLKEIVLKEADYRKLIVEHYTFLNRPVIIYDEHVFVGSSKSVVEEAMNVINK